jgi:CelD/BcsL family acetyltransferase involved in cellulose biosynthesis
LSGLAHRPGEAVARDLGLVHQSVGMPAFFVDLAKLADSRGDLTAVLGRNARQQLRRAIRHYATQGRLALAEAQSTEQAVAFFDGMKQLHIASWQRRGRPHAFSRPHFETFHRALIARAFPTGQLQLLRLAAGASTIGYLYNFRRDGHVYSYQSGFDDRDPKAHPGYVSHYLAIEHNFVQGARVYDFLAGRNRLKETLATNRSEMYWDTVRRPLLRFRLESAAQDLKRRIFPDARPD